MHSHAPFGQHCTIAIRATRRVFRGLCSWCFELDIPYVRSRIFPLKKLSSPMSFVSCLIGDCRCSILWNVGPTLHHLRHHTPRGGQLQCHRQNDTEGTRPPPQLRSQIPPKTVYCALLLRQYVVLAYRVGILLFEPHYFSCYCPLSLGQYMRRQRLPPARRYPTYKLTRAPICITLSIAPGRVTILLLLWQPLPAIQTVRPYVLGFHRICLLTYCKVFFFTLPIMVDRGPTRKQFHF